MSLQILVSLNLSSKWIHPSGDSNFHSITNWRWSKNEISGLDILGH